MRHFLIVLLVTASAAFTPLQSRAAADVAVAAPMDAPDLDDPAIPSVKVVPGDPGIKPTLAPPTMDLTAIPRSLWQRIRNGFGLPDISSPLVREQEDWFASRPDYLRRTVARSNRFLYHIVEELEKRGMPTEIALLPIIESAYNPAAYSRANASGIWQFIPSTGKLYGLQQNFWYNGRRDVMAATNAALDYLEKLYDMFGSWDLALAAYNWGEGAVARAIAKNEASGRPTDYQSLTMPLETRYYVPKLQAVKNIIADPAHYGIDLADIPNQPYFVAVATDKPIDVKLAAKFAGVPLEEFMSLNPGYNRPVIKADSTQMLLLPADKADAFRAKLEGSNQPLVSWRTYTLKSGDRLDRVAARHGMSLAQLKQVNGITPRRKVGPGLTVLVAAAPTSTAHLPDLPAPPVAAPRTRGKASRYAAARHGHTKLVRARAAVRKPAASAKKAPPRGAKKILVAQYRAQR